MEEEYKHIEYWCFAPSQLDAALEECTIPDAAKQIVKQFLYGAKAEQHKLFHTNETIGGK